MTSQAPIENNEKVAAVASTRTRSPGYPSLSLQDAIEKAKVVWTQEKRNAAPLEALALDWGLKAKSSTGLLYSSTLKKYGLLEEVEGGKDRSMKLTQAALNIILNDQHDSAEYINLLKQCALSPKIYADLWQKYNGDLPSDANLKRYLIVELKFNDAAVDGIIRDFRDTITFAKLSNSDKITITESADSETEEKMKLGQNLDQKRGLGEPHALTAAEVATKLVAGSAAGTSFATGSISVLREFTVPLSVGTIALRVPYPMDEDDFQLFLDTLTLWKRQLVKKPAAKTSEELLQEIEKRQKPWPKPPFAAMWKNKHCDTMIEIVGEMGEKDGVKFYQSKDGTGIPAYELFPGIK